MNPVLRAALEEFDDIIRPLHESGVLPRRDPAKYRFRVNYPPSAFFESSQDEYPRAELLSLIPIDNRIGLYVHVPFCRRICTFCHFSVGRLPGESQLSQHIAMLLEELDLWMTNLPAGTTIDSVYIGGGTPTALPTTLLVQLITTLREAACPHVAEVTVEASPGTLTAHTAEALRSAGVTRISLGVQDLAPGMPQLLGRDHTSADAVAALHLVRREWPETANVDLILGLPGQCVESWFETLRSVTDVGMPSVTVYQLHIASGTPLRKLWERAPHLFPGELPTLVMRWVAHRVLQASASMQDPIDWYIRSLSARCRHQSAKWSADAGLLALGPGVYWGSPVVSGRNLGQPYWAEALEQRRLPISYCSGLAETHAAARYAVFALKTGRGINLVRLRHYAQGAGTLAQVEALVSQFPELFEQTAGWVTASHSLGMLRLEEIAEWLIDEQTRAQLAAAGVSPYSE